MMLWQNIERGIFINPDYDGRYESTQIDFTPKGQGTRAVILHAVVCLFRIIVVE